MFGFVQREGQQLVLNGAPFPIAGVNNYYLGYVREPVVTAVLDAAEALGANVIRAWCFCDVDQPSDTGFWLQSWDAASKTAIVHDGPNGLDRLDLALSLAAARGIRLILTLTNNWQDFGGMPQYAKWLGLEAPGEFYWNDAARDAYRNWVRTILTRQNKLTGVRYADEPAILAWELANEPRCETANGVDILLDWVRAMSAYIRALDPNHLVAVGDEGYFRHAFAFGNELFNGKHGVSCEELLGIGEIDFGTFHMYPDSMGKGQDPAVFGEMWIREHIEAGKRANKPMLLEEYGLINASAADRDRIFRGWLDVVETHGGAGALLWMLGLAKGPEQPYAPDGYVISDVAAAESVREYAARKLPKRLGAV